MREGESFAAALLARGVFPDVAVKMVEVGESTGALQEMLNSLAEFYDEEIETEVARFITLVEPLILVVMGVVIALVVLALYMPLFELSSVVGAVNAEGTDRRRRSRRISSTTPEDYSEESRARASLPSVPRSNSSTWTSSAIDQELFRSIPADLMLRYGFVPYRRDGKSLVIVVSDPTDLPMIDEIGVVLSTPIKVTVGAPLAIQSILKKSESSQRVLEEATEGFQLKVAQGRRDRGRKPHRRQADERHQPGHPARRLDGVHRDPAARERHPHRDRRRCGAREIPDRRRAAAGDAADREGVPQPDHFAHQGHGGARHRREARPAGRPLQAAHAGQDDRFPRLDHAERARRGRGHPYPRQGIDQRAVHGAEARHPRVSRSRSCGGSASTSASRTAWCSSPARPVRGKTTTLYAALSEIKSIEDKIVTIEDPVEYQLRGITQIPINEKKGLTFARGLRSILRHDPDKIMVGEIRDPETAQIAIQSALTGHLVFTTVHANNVVDVLGRFLNMGVEPYQFVSALNCVLAQRLVRLICAHCKRPVKVDAKLLEESALDPALGADAPVLSRAPAASSAAARASRDAPRSASCSTCPITSVR